MRVSLQPGLVERLDHAERGRRALAAARHLAARAGAAHDGPVGLSLLPTRRVADLPALRVGDVELTSEFGSTACKAMYRCTSCLEPFEHVKEI